MNTTLNSELIEAYKATNFHVNAETPFILNISVESLALKKIYDLYQVKTAAFITAFNPFGELLAIEENAIRNIKLRDELKNLDFKYIAGVGQDPLGQWPGEESYLVLDLTLSMAKELGTKYGQNAIVWCDADAVPELVFLV